MIRVLVVEDSPTVSQLLVSMLESDPDIRVVGRATDGAEAVRKALRLSPDLITMDVMMPGMDGLAATREIMTVAPTPIIIVSSVATQSSVSLSLDATQAGALMVLPKPEGPSDDSFEAQREQLVTMAKAMAHVKVVRQWAQQQWPGLTPGEEQRALDARTGDVRIVTIGCSTGGPAALRQLLGEMPATLRVPILVVQHMAHGFAEGLARWLDSGTPLRVKLAEDLEPLAPGTVYVAPDDVHLGVTRDNRARLLGLPPIGGFRPSISHLFTSAAEVHGPGAVGVLLTGMGSDGVAGLADLKRAGGIALVQDESTSVVYGMAQEAVRAGLPDAILPLPVIAPRLLELIR